jgi:hypothetical protein
LIKSFINIYIYIYIYNVAQRCEDEHYSFGAQKYFTIIPFDFGDPRLSFVDGFACPIQRMDNGIPKNKDRSHGRCMPHFPVMEDACFIGIMFHPFLQACSVVV